MFSFILLNFRPHYQTTEIKIYAHCPPKKGLKVAKWGLFSTGTEGWLYSYPQISSFIHLQRRHAPHSRERPLLAKEGTITKEFS